MDRPLCIGVTGASGFVGGVLLERLARERYNVVALVRQPIALQIAAVRVIGDLENAEGLIDALKGVDVLIHLAARAHVMREHGSDALSLYRAVNVEGTRKLATDAAAAGVRRLVFVSSIKVNGEQTVPGKPFTAADQPAPADAYGQSKWEAERALREVTEQTGLEVAVIRPPLVYGPGVKANFERLMRWVRAGIPLPLGAVDNRRSMIALDNLVDLLVRCVDHPDAASQTFLVSDGGDLSTPDLVRRLASVMGRRSWLLPVPEPLLRFAGGLTGQHAAVGRLCGSLQVDASATRERLGWTPPVHVDEALGKTVRAFLNRHGKAS